MKKTRSIREGLFRDDFDRKEKMFDVLVDGVALYGAEIWRWKNDTKLDRIARKAQRVDLRTGLENTELHCSSDSERGKRIGEERNGKHEEEC